MTAVAINPSAGQPTNGPEFRYIKARDLKLDQVINREVDQAWVQHLARNFDPANVGTLVVSVRPNGDRIVIDGQHRKLAASDALRDDFYFHCELRFGLSKAEEAALFLEMNKRRTVSPVDRFRKAVVAGREPESSVSAILVSLGIEMNRGTAARSVGGPRAVESIFSKGGEDLLRLTITTTLAAWPDDQNALREEIIRGLGEFLHRHSAEIDISSLTRRLETRKTPGGLRGEAQTARSIHGGALWTHVADSLVNVYNHGRKQTLPRWS